jgi:hypothetical protein
MNRNVRTLRNASLVPLRAPSFGATRPHRHTAGNNHFGWSPPLGRSSHTESRGRALLAVDLLLEVSAGGVGGVRKVGMGAEMAWERGWWVG